MFVAAAGGSHRGGADRDERGRVQYTNLPFFLLFFVLFCCSSVKLGVNDDAVQRLHLETDTTEGGKVGNGRELCAAPAGGAGAGCSGVGWS